MGEEHGTRATGSEMRLGRWHVTRHVDHCVHCRKVIRDRMTRDNGGWAGVKMRDGRGDKQDVI